MKVEFKIPGKPQGKARPRFTRHGIIYTPKETQDYEKEVANAYNIAAKGMSFGSEAVMISVKVYYPVPKSWSTSKRKAALQGDIRPTLKPDGDNILKIIADIINAQPAVDVQEVMHGKWIGTVCSFCGESTSNYYDCNYCPHCGARMDGEKNDKKGI